MLNYIYDSYLLLIPSTAFILSVVLKWFFSVINTWKLNLSVALGSWWMPSAHTAVSVSLTTAIVIKYWIYSDWFAIALSFTVIIIYDAINIRYEAWLHAKALNKYIWEKRFRETLWHLPSEAFAWSLLGIFTAIFYSFF